MFSGYYCNGPGLPAPTGKCDAGYYCPQGSSSQQENECASGYYCEQVKLTKHDTLWIQFTVIILCTEIKAQSGAIFFWSTQNVFF